MDLGDAEEFDPRYHSKPQGIEAIRAAALDGVRAHLEEFPESMAFEDIWENHPLLIEREATQAQELAAFVANQLFETLTEAAVFMFTKRVGELRCDKCGQLVDADFLESHYCKLGIDWEQ